MQRTVFYSPCGIFSLWAKSSLKLVIPLVRAVAALQLVLKVSVDGARVVLYSHLQRNVSL